MLPPHDGVEARARGPRRCREREREKKKEVLRFFPPKEEEKKDRGSKTYDTGVSRLVTHASTKPSSRMLNFEVLMDLGAFTLIWSYDASRRNSI